MDKEDWIHLGVHGSKGPGLSRWLEVKWTTYYSLCRLLAFKDKVIELSQEFENLFNSANSKITIDPQYALNKLASCWASVPSNVRERCSRIVSWCSSIAFEVRSATYCERKLVPVDDDFAWHFLHNRLDEKYSMAVVDTLSEIYGSQTESIDLENVFNKTVDIPGELFPWVWRGCAQQVQLYGASRTKFPKVPCWSVSLVKVSMAGFQQNGQRWTHVIVAISLTDQGFIYHTLAPNCLQKWCKRCACGDDVHTKVAAILIHIFGNHSLSKSTSMRTQLRLMAARRRWSSSMSFTFRHLLDTPFRKVKNGAVIQDKEYRLARTDQMK